MEEQGERFVGRRMKRREDLPVLLGQTKYLDDISLPGMTYLGIVRSPYARARVLSVGFDAVRKLTGVREVLTPEDVLTGSGTLPLLSGPSGSRSIPSKAVADRISTFAGEPIAAVVVGRRYDIPGAVERVRVEYEALPPVVDARAALDPGAPLVFAGWSDNIAFSTVAVKGDPDGAFSKAAVVVSEDFEITRQYGAAIEPRGVVASYERGSDKLTVWSSTQWPHFVRTLLSEVLMHPESRLRVIAPDVGGGFGNKQDLYREEILTCLASKMLGTPVKWVATRSEDFTSTVHSGDQYHHGELALDGTGRILGLRDSIIADIGSYGPMSIGPPSLTLKGMTGPYAIENMHLDLRCVVTNKVLVGAYRGFGQQQGAFALERLLDSAADRMGLDPADIRRRNLITKFPYETATGRVIESGNFTGMLDLALQESGYAAFRGGGGQAGHIARGVGLAFGLEGAGIGPKWIQDAMGARHKGYETMTVRVLPTGSIEVLSGLSPHGQGLATTLSQVCADQFGVDPSEVSVTFGDTDSAPYGFGTWGSRSAVLGAGALAKCAQRLKSKMVEVASQAMSIPQAELRYSGGGVVLLSSPDKKMSLREISRCCYEMSKTPSSLEATETYEPPGLTVSGGVHIVFVSVDTETGRVKVDRFLSVDDSGVMINPSIVEGQIIGGVVQGVSAATLEGLHYGEDGQLLTTTFMDYFVPSASDVPPVELTHLDSPSPLNELGVKGIGESGIIGPTAAVANALCDALRDYGIRFNSIPILSPVVWGKLAEGRERRSAPRAAPGPLQNL